MSTMPLARLVPRSLTELGRIRAGDRVANSSGKGTHPRSLTHWRLTSKDRTLLEHMAASPALGGTVQRWEGPQVQGVQYELYTSTDTLTICLPTFKPISLAYELWSAAGCQRRCDGLTVERCALTPALVGQACQCPADDAERAALAAKGQACARILRLWVLLPDVPGVGFWRLESHGFYAASELLGQLAVWQQAGLHSGIIEGRLRLEQREQKRPGAENLKYVVPVFTTSVTLRQIAQAAQTQQGFLVQPADAPLVPQLHTAQAVAEIWGAEAAARFLPEAAPQPMIDVVATPVLPPPVPPPDPARLADAVALRTAIDDLLLRQGIEQRRITQWHRERARQYKVETWADMPVELLREILARLEAAARKVEVMQAPDEGGSPPALTDEELDGWRAPLLRLSLDVLSFLDGSQEAEYAAYVRDNCARAEQVLRDRQTTESDAEYWFDLLRAMSDRLSQQLGLDL